MEHYSTKKTQKKDSILLIIGIIFISIGTIPIFTQYVFNIAQSSRISPSQIITVAKSSDNPQIENEQFQTINNLHYIGTSVGNKTFFYKIILTFTIPYFSFHEFSNLQLHLNGNLNYWVLPTTSFNFGISLETFDNSYNINSFTWDTSESITTTPQDYISLTNQNTQNIIFESESWINELSLTGKINCILDIYLTDVLIQSNEWITFITSQSEIYLSYNNYFFNTEGVWITFSIVEFIGLIFITIYIISDKKL